MRRSIFEMETDRRIEILGQGTITVQSESPYEKLDAESQLWLNNLKTLCVQHGLKNCNATIQMVNDFFSKSQNPYVSALQLMLTCGDFYSGKQNSLALYIINIFSNWQKDKPLSHLITKELKYDVFNFVIRQTNLSLIKTVVETYKMIDDKEIFLEPIRYLIKGNRYKQACQCAILLKLHKYFKLEDFLIPLVFQDKYVIAKEFLDDSREHQIQLATFLDKLLGTRNIKAEAEIISRKYNIPDVNLSTLYHKPLSKLVAKIVKSYDLPPDVCPNLNRGRGKGALQFLFNKRFIEKTIGVESWSEMAVEAVGDDQSLQAELVNNVAIYGELKEALHWAERFGVPEDAWPFKLKEFAGRTNQESAYSGGYADDENWDDFGNEFQTSSVKFHKLPIDESLIAIVDTASGFSDFLSDITTRGSVVGIDAEWKPSFGLKKCELSLIQVATFSFVYILDVIALSAVASDALWKRFVNELFANPNVLKLGFGLGGDLNIIKETLRKFHAVKMMDSGFLDLSLLWKILVNDYNFAFPYPYPCSSSSESLNCLIELCFGEELDKSDQFSNWENRPLRRSQIVYAAVDAYCLLEVYNVMRRECELQNVPFAQIIAEIMNGTTPKKAKKKTASSPSRKSASKVRVLCDSALEALGVQLRRCGVDTIIFDGAHEPPVVVMKENVTVLIVTQRRSFGRFNKLGRVYCVKSMNLKQQLKEVLDYLKIDTAEGRACSRCLVCNSNDFETMSRSEMNELVSPAVRPPLRQVFEDPEQECYFQNYNYPKEGRKTGEGVSIAVGEVPSHALANAPIFYVCVKCGKCYWDGCGKTKGFGGFIGQSSKS